MRLRPISKGGVFEVAGAPAVLNAALSANLGSSAQRLVAPKSTPIGRHRPTDIDGLLHSALDTPIDRDELAGQRRFFPNHRLGSHGRRMRKSTSARPMKPTHTRPSGSYARKSRDILEKRGIAVLPAKEWRKAVPGWRGGEDTIPGIEGKEVRVLDAFFFEELSRRTPALTYRLPPPPGMNNPARSGKACGGGRTPLRGYRARPG
jgi:hypothetical protein